MAAGSLLCAVGLALMGLVPHPVTYVAGWLVLGVAMRLALYDAAFTSLTQIAGDGARRAISYLSLFGGFASTAFWPLSHVLSERFGWAEALCFYAALHLLVCLPIHLTVLRPSGQRSFAPAAADTGGPEPLSGAERRRAMILFALALALNGLVFSSISAHAVPLFEGLGFTGAEAVTFAALIGPSQVASRITEILFGRKLKAVHLGVLAFGLLPVAIAVFSIGGFTAAAALAFALLYGASNGIVTIAKGAVPLALFGRNGFGEVIGRLAAPNLVLNAVAPLLFAWILDLAGPQESLLIAMGVAALSGLAMTTLARLHRR